jgi:hypothetical protein
VKPSEVIFEVGAVVGIDASQRTGQLIDRLGRQKLTAHPFLWNRTLKPNRAAMVIAAPLRVYMLRFPTRSYQQSNPWHFACSICNILCYLYFLRSCPWFADISIRSKEHMPRYYFDFQDDSSLFKDEFGEVFADASSALQRQADCPRIAARR